jgi:ubiquinone/menaquinone biosynthesis C-methylase UbiE
MFEPTLSDWDELFARQAKWTRMTRNQLYRRVNLMQAQRILDVGCGTGVITNELAHRTRGTVIGLDIDPEMFAFARGQTTRVRYREGNVLDLPYPDEHFDIVTCHFLLMWISDPILALREMARVVRPKGYVLVCAEPDYGGRLDWPDLPIRHWQIAGLRRQGADPHLGRRLRQLMSAANLRAQVGVIPSHWDAQALYEDFDSEWRWIEYDARDVVHPSMVAQTKAQAKAAVDAGTWLVYVPVFYAVGRKVSATAHSIWRPLSNGEGFFLSRGVSRTGE